jgi:hypothetical protein
MSLTCKRFDLNHSIHHMFHTLNVIRDFIVEIGWDCHYGCTKRESKETAKCMEEFE